MQITIEQAKAILEALPCDCVAYNCWSADEMVEEAAGVSSNEELIQLLIDIEEVNADRYLGAQDWGDEETNTRLDEQIDETKNFLAEYKSEVKKIINNILT